MKKESGEKREIEVRRGTGEGEEEKIDEGARASDGGTSRSLSLSYLGGRSLARQCFSGSRRLLGLLGSLLLDCLLGGGRERREEEKK